MNELLEIGIDNSPLLIRQCTVLYRQNNRDRVQLLHGMSEPRCIMASVFIDDCTPVTSPLLVIPRTQQLELGLLDAKLHKDSKGRGCELHPIDQTTMKQLANENGIGN